MRLLLIAPAIVTFIGGAALLIYYSGIALDCIERRIDTYTEMKAFWLAVGWATMGFCAALTALYSLAG